MNPNKINDNEQGAGANGWSKLPCRSGLCEFLRGILLRPPHGRSMCGGPPALPPLQRLRGHGGRVGRWDAGRGAGDGGVVQGAGLLVPGDSGSGAQVAADAAAVAAPATIPDAAVVVDDVSGMMMLWCVCVCLLVCLSACLSVGVCPSEATGAGVVCRSRVGRGLSVCP